MRTKQMIKGAAVAAAAAATGLLLSLSVHAADITGAGATFPFPIYSKWADAYKKETSNGLNYQSIGSGAGIKEFCKGVGEDTIDIANANGHCLIGGPIEISEIECHAIGQIGIIGNIKSAITIQHVIAQAA